MVNQGVSDFTKKLGRGMACILLKYRSWQKKNYTSGMRQKNANAWKTWKISYRLISWHGKGWAAQDIFWKNPSDRVGLQNLFESLSQQVKRKKVQPVGKKECEQIKKEVIAYLDAFVNAVGDQTEAREFVEQHKDEVISETKTNKNGEK